MSQLIGLACTLMLLFSAQNAHGDRFLKFKAVEAYEIRPGILMMPRYTEDGQVCEIGLAKQHYLSGELYLDSSLSRKDIDEIANDLVPGSERGQKMMDRDSITGVGRGMTTSSIYENVSIEIYSSILSTSNKHQTVVDDIAAAIKWKNRKCE